MRGAPLLSALFLCALIALGAPTSRGEISKPTFVEVLSQFDPAMPGYDYDSAAPTIKTSQAMALAMYLVGTVRAGTLTEARVAADQLVEMRHHTSGVGWGLGFPWNAFATEGGSPNPSDTIYGITVAVVVRGLFDFYDATGDVKYRDAALEGLAYYRANAYVPSSSGAGGPGGFFWYSNQPADQGTHAVLNVTAMLMGQYARAYAYTGIADYQDIARRCERYVWAKRTAVGPQIKWPYKVGANGGSSQNDAIHAAFIVQGFIDVGRYLPPLFDITPAIDYLASLAASMTSGKQRLWGAGMMMFTLADAGRMAEANAVITNVLSRFPVSNGRYGFATNSAAPYLRHTSFLLAGLARIEAASGLRIAAENGRQSIPSR